MSGEVAELMTMSLRPEEICSTRITESAQLAAGPVQLLEGSRNAALSRGVRDYQMLVDELVGAGFVP